MRILILVTSFVLLTACGEANNQAQIVVLEVEGLKLTAQTFNLDVSRLSCCAG